MARVKRCRFLPALFVRLPPSAGIAGAPHRLSARLPLVNQGLVVAIVWMGTCQTREALLRGGGSVFQVLLVAAAHHGPLPAAVIGVTRVSRMDPGRRESVIFMGARKTLPLSIILQVTPFPRYGQALVFCVVHHLVHPMTDSWLVVRLKGRR